MLKIKTNYSSPRQKLSRLDVVLCSLLWVTLLRQGVGLGDPQRSLPTPTILGFCDKAVNWSQQWKGKDSKHLVRRPRRGGYRSRRTLAKLWGAGLSLCFTPVPDSNGIRDHCWGWRAAHWGAAWSGRWKPALEKPRINTTAKNPPGLLLHNPQRLRLCPR